MKIQDGSGNGNWLKINKDLRALTKAISQTEQRHASENGDSYQVGSGVINLTSANESAVLYVKNNEERDFQFTGVNITSSAMTGSSANVFLAKVYLGGTALSAGTSANALNNNFGSSKTLDADITQGQEAATVTDGTASGAFYIPNETFFATDIAWLIPRGTSVAISITPGASNTSMNVSVTLEGHLIEEN